MRVKQKLSKSRTNPFVAWHFIGVPLGRMLQSHTIRFKYSQNVRPHFFGLHNIASRDDGDEKSVCV